MSDINKEVLDLLDRMQGRVDEAIIATQTRRVLNGDKPSVIYSAYSTTNEDLPTDNLDDVAVEGRVIFLMDHKPFFGGGEDWQSDVVENPTWLEVAVLADDMIRTTGDYHHVFLEDVEGVGQEKDGLKFARMVMGS